MPFLADGDVGGCASRFPHRRTALGRLAGRAGRGTERRRRRGRHHLDGQALQQPSARDGIELLLGAAGSSRPGPHHPAGDPDRAGHHPRRPHRRRGLGPHGAGSGRAGRGDRAAVGRRAGRGRRLAGPRRTRRRGCRRTRLPAPPDPRRLPHHPGHGPRPAPAPSPGRRPPHLPGSAPRRAARRRRRGCGGRGGGRARSDRVLLLRVVVYYAVANASAWTLTPGEGLPHRLIPAVGPAGCLLLAFALPLSSMVSRAAVPAVGVAAYEVRRAVAAHTS